MGENPELHILFNNGSHREHRKPLGCERIEENNQSMSQSSTLPLIGMVNMCRWLGGEWRRKRSLGNGSSHSPSKPSLPPMM